MNKDLTMRNDNLKSSESAISGSKIEKSLMKIRNMMIIIEMASRHDEGDVDFSIAVNGIAKNVEEDLNELIQDIQMSRH